MGLVKSFKKLLKSSDKPEATSPDAQLGTHSSPQHLNASHYSSAQPSSSSPHGSSAGSPLKADSSADGEFARRVASSTGAGPSGKPLAHPNSSLLLGVGGRIASFTSTERYGMSILTYQLLFAKEPAPPELTAACATANAGMKPL